MHVKRGDELRACDRGMGLRPPQGTIQTVGLRLEHKTAGLKCGRAHLGGGLALRRLIDPGKKPASSYFNLVPPALKDNFG